MNKRDITLITLLMKLFIPVSHLSRLPRFYGLCKIFCVHVKRSVRKHVLWSKNIVLFNYK